jgi:hypothetical protein
MNPHYRTCLQLISVVSMVIVVGILIAGILSVLFGGG